MVTWGRCLVEADFALEFRCKQQNLRSLRRFSSPQKVLRLFGDPILGIVAPWRKLWFFRTPTQALSADRAAYSCRPFHGNAALFR